MKFIKIFLASSIVEFQNERQQMGNFIRSLNDTYVKRGIYFELFICEDLSDSVAQERKQQEYNELIRDSQYFYILFGRAAGEYTIEEFYVALEQYRKSGAPRIFTYFRKLSEGERADESVMNFMEQLSSRIGHYYSSFTHLDAIKLNLLLELVKDPKLNDQMRFEDGQVVLGDQPMMSLEHVPLYSNNETMQELIREQTQLNEEFGRLAVEYGKRPEDAGLLKQMMELGERRTHVRDSIHRIEMDMLGLYSQVEEKRQAGRTLNWREKKAIDRVDMGDYEGAKNILRDTQWEQEVSQAEERVEAAVEPIREYISGKRSLISTLMVTGPDAEAREEILSIYERCCSLAERYQIEMEVLCDYAKFLRRQRAYPQGIQAAERLERYYEQRPETPDADRAVLLSVLGMLYGENRDFHKAEQALRKAVMRYRRLAAGSHVLYEAELARSINSLAVVLHHLNRLEEEEKLLREALGIFRRLAEEHPSAYEAELALACGNLAILVDRQNQTEEAKALYDEALRIRRRLVRTQTGRSDIPVAELARGCGNLANFMSRINQMEQAEALYQEALELRLRLMQDNPAVYGADLAAAYHDLAVFRTKQNQPEEAERLHRKAWKIRQDLASANPDAYEPELAKSCEDLAFLYYRVYRLAEAERLYREALAIYRRLVKRNPEAYESGLAGSCIHLANMLNTEMQDPEEGKRLYEEGLAVYDRLAAKDPEVFEPYVAAGCSGLALLLQACGDMEGAEEQHRRSLRIRERLASANPEVYDPFLAESCNRLANLLSIRGQSREAELLYCRALELRRHRREDGKDAYPIETARSCHDLAVFYKDRGEKEKAEPLYREAWEIYHQLSEAHPGSYDAYLSPAGFNLAVLLKDMGRYEESAGFCREALAADRRMAAANPKLYAEYPAETGCFLAELLYDRDREEARRLYREALQIYEGRPGKDAKIQRIRKLLEEPMEQA